MTKLGTLLGVVGGGASAIGLLYAATRVKRKHRVQSQGIPCALPTGKVWPLADARARVASYTRDDGVVIGNASQRFGASREGGRRRHAGVDITTVPGQPIVAMEAGRVIGNLPGFVGLDAILVAHASVLVVYAEVRSVGRRANESIAAGDTIAEAAQSSEGSMLHVETWERGHAPAGFTPWIGLLPPPGLPRSDALPPGLAVMAKSTRRKPRRRRRRTASPPRRLARELEEVATRHATALVDMAIGAVVGFVAGALASAPKEEPPPPALPITHSGFGVYRIGVDDVIDVEGVVVEEDGVRRLPGPTPRRAR